MIDLPKTSRAACVVAYQQPLEIRDVPIPQVLEPGADLVRGLRLYLFVVLMELVSPYKG
jgi:hypothetical protein